jgi:3-dehydroquinate synthase
MQHKKFQIGNASVDYYFSGGFSHLKQIVEHKKAVIITDENVFTNHEKKFKGWNTIVLKAGEAYKVQATVDSVIGQLIDLGADRTTTLVGVGGGVITDLTGYIASVYMRGISFGFIPTTLLALVDASIGGKNGIDVGLYKNMVGIIRQPQFILHDLVFLNTLPQIEWQGGFSEIIKHACIRDASMFKQLEASDISLFQKKKKLLCELVQRNAILKTKVVQSDELEKGDRKLLNFGHTLGHALENQYQLTHGQAVSIGMVFAAKISEPITGFKAAEKLKQVLTQYELPTEANYQKDKVFDILKKDKKKNADHINFILLERIGRGRIQQISLDQLYAAL